LKEQARLFESSRTLQKIAANHPLFPHAPDAEHENDVYMTQGVKAGDVIFKPGEAAKHNTICAGFSRLLGLSDSLPLAKRGEASVIARQDLDVLYRRLTNLSGEDVLVDLSGEDVKKAKNVTISPNGDVSCRVEGKSVWISAVPPPSDKTSIELAADEENRFEILEDDNKNLSLVPEKQVHDVNIGKSRTGKFEWIEIDHTIYQVIEDARGGGPKLKWMDVPKNANHPANEKYTESKWQRLNRENEEGELEEVLVPSQLVVKLDENDRGADTLTFNHEGKRFQAEWGDQGKYSIEPISEELLTLVQDESGNYYVLPKEDESVIFAEGDAEYVRRFGQQYQIANKGQDYTVIGHQVRGVVQAKVENTFTKPKHARRDMDIRRATAERQKFYDRIDMKSFEEAFLLTILLRPQDGKVIDLGQSNVLFQAIPNDEEPVDPQDENVKLRPVLIDLDETFPPSNTYSSDPDYIVEGEQTVHCVRCGLMGFPQARKPLDESEREVMNVLAAEIAEQEKRLLNFLHSHTRDSKNFKAENVVACKEVMDKVVAFINENRDRAWTLEELFFHVFPEYQSQWEFLANMPPEDKASHIGLLSQSALERLRK
jgi:hypothetical protein